MVRLLLTVFVMLCAFAAALFGVLYFAGLKADVTDKYGVPGRAVAIIVTALTVPLFNLGRFIARRRRPPEE